MLARICNSLVDDVDHWMRTDSDPARSFTRMLAAVAVCSLEKLMTCQDTTQAKIHARHSRYITIASSSVRIGLPTTYDCSSVTLSLLSSAVAQPVNPALWPLHGHLLQLTTQYQIAGASTRPGGRCMRLVRRAFITLTCTCHSSQSLNTLARTHTIMSWNSLKLWDAQMS